ncbi:MAG: GNAT family N-acetyltransferase [Devosia sp.]|uniref:GNAT family N-acetyltransferase n=1 Tax=Devosia sp. TaxID=1871048 RepID=UPI0024CB9330|nr:GNAT family N-acetyltransferase [Devosia sp.]UYN98615.1 MAG: GNAT family N-acetyltransferase [Devosia sp.]
MRLTEPTTPVLRTRRLVLRAPRMEDAPDIARHLNNFEVSGNLARVPFPYHLSDARAWIRSRQGQTQPGEANFTIEVDGMGYVGHLGFHMQGEEPGVGYWLGRPFWGKGIMSEAVEAAINWLFSASDFATIRSGVFYFNAASLAIQTKLGFTETGRSSLLCLARGAEVEHIDTQLTRERFQHMRQASRS